MFTRDDWPFLMSIEAAGPAASSVPMLLYADYRLERGDSAGSDYWRLVADRGWWPDLHVGGLGAKHLWVDEGMTLSASHPVRSRIPNVLFSYLDAGMTITWGIGYERPAAAFMELWYAYLKFNYHPAIVLGDPSIEPKEAAEIVQERIDKATDWYRCSTEIYRELSKCQPWSRLLKKTQPGVPG